MNRFLLALGVCALLALAPARAEVEGDAPSVLTPREISELSLDALFEKLPQNAGTPAGGRIEREIIRRFGKSGSDTADLLLTWASEAMEEKKFPLALDVLNQIVIIKPDFAEAWNRRATVYFLTEDYSSSLADIRQTLALEPRHFGALSGLGMIFQSLDRNADAIRVFKRALEINPQLENVRKSLEELEKEAAGQAI